MISFFCFKPRGGSVIEDTASSPYGHQRRDLHMPKPLPDCRRHTGRWVRAPERLSPRKISKPNTPPPRKTGLFPSPTVHQYADL